MKSNLSKHSIKLFIYFLSFRKVKIISYILICLLSGAIPSIDSILLQKVIDLIESSSSNKLDSSVMLFWALAYTIWWETLNIWWRMYDYLFMTTFPFIKSKIINELYNHTQHHSHRFFQNNLAGHITNRITEGARSFEMVCAILAEKIIRKIAVIIFALITLYMVHKTFATIFLIWLTVFMGLSLYFASNINKYSRLYAKNKANVAGKIVDAIANINVVRIFTSHKFERKYLDRNLDTMVESDQAMQWFMFKLRYVLGISCSVMIFTMLYYLFRLRTDSIISIGDCVLILTLCLVVADDISDLTQEIGDMFEELGTFNQSITLIMPHEIVDVEHSKELIVTQGVIEFSNVTFRYKNNYNIFNDKSVVIHSKQKVGLVGYSGSGKSSFINLIARLYDIESGSILIDGQDISGVTQDSLREVMSIIPQEPILFHRTIMENIKYGKKNATDEEAIEVAKLAHIHEFIIELPDGYNTLCGERGNNLSGGQRQRIVIARAILKNAPILILDEATSSLDSNTETLIQESLKYLMQNKTVIVIAHRLLTLLNMDRILVFDKGIIIADGTHDELLKNCKLYQKLWFGQIDHASPEGNYIK